MKRTIRLADYGIRIFRATLETHDYLWFSSYDASGFSSTEVALHNYALSYALSRYERGLSFGRAPDYETDLAAMPLYTTPADLVRESNPYFGKVVHTWNAVDTLTQRTDDPAFKDRNTPMLGKRSAVTPGTRFAFYVFTFDGRRPPGAIRLGKKRAPCRVIYVEVSNPVARYDEDVFTVSHLVNPLDVTGKVLAFTIVNIPPFLLLRDARLQGDYVVADREGRRRNVVHIPKRVLARCEVV